MNFQLTFKTTNPEQYVEALYPLCTEAIIGLNGGDYIAFDFHTEEYGSDIISEKINGIKSIVPDAQLVNLIV